MENNLVYRSTESFFKYQAWPSVCIDEEGVLYAVCSGHRVSHVCPFGMNLMFVSFDGGKVWSSPIIINDSWLDDRDCGICYLGNGKMIMSYFCHPTEFYTESNLSNSIMKMTDDYSRDFVGATLGTYPSFTESMNKSGSFVRISDNKGMTWSAPIKLPVSAPHGPVFTSRSKRLLYLGKEMYSGITDENKKDQIMLYESTNGGFDWEYVSTVPLPEGYSANQVHEPHLTELPNGDLLAALRCHCPNGVPYKTFTIYLSTSKDGGKTWSDPAATGICGSPPHLLTLSDGSVVLSYGRREEPYGIRAVISRDGFKTFGDEIVIDSANDSDLGYPATAEMRDGKLITVYYKRYESDRRTSIFSTVWDKS